MDDSQLATRTDVLATRVDVSELRDSLKTMIRTAMIVYTAICLLVTWLLW